MNELIQEINDFRDERNWRPYNTPKSLAISITLEASELLENFQWCSSEEAVAATFENIQEELADVLIYSLMLASDLELDVSQIIQEKLKKNALKYPVVQEEATNDSSISK
ncbi:nucleotide pyrophosphohydrolase [Enterococcus ureasiticus]|uniref:Nucleotide pyrophosphohydrolase n=1 Tax=Enterococcus ureasiticus TaxID=903984 RepID=A0A1E5GH30_9ENTE|nr:nucleotide pyrophosphohydrolase [Enterococcus ureasiticus]OEG11550.1 nucleotide pyrophosphohydrolase [Enterococcus ureasiticus]